MPDEHEPETPESAPVPESEAPPADAATATAEPLEEGGEKPPKPLNQQVDIADAGPCKKHIKVTIPREDIQERLNEKFSEMVVDANVPGYRPGKAPRKLIERRYYKDVSEQVKAEILLQSLEQLGADHQITPLTQPDIDPFKVELPKEGPLLYEFDVEVPPEFELPSYKGLKLKRPTRDVTEADVDKALNRAVSRHGKLVSKDAPADIGDHIACDVITMHDGKQLGKMKDITLKIDPQLAFKDGMVKDFGAKMKGVKAGERRTVGIMLSPNAATPELRGQVIDATFAVKDVKRLQMPELTHELLHAAFDVHSEEELRERVRGALQRQLEYAQRQSARGQVLEHIAASATWELPQDLLVRQSQKTLNRRILEMRSGGLPEDEIRSRSTMLRQDAMASTERALKEHFVLQKISEAEKLEVTEEDVNFEIENIALQTGESPRRVRARIEKDQMGETLAAEILERKALTLVLDHADYEDVPFEQPTATETVEEQAIPGEEPTPAVPNT